MVNVEIMSREMIKPSSPTPHHLRVLKLSFLDQFAPLIYVPIVLFYHNDSCVWGSNIDCSQLKKSLAETLTHFYPLAGTVKEDISIECDDEGAEFSEARVSCKLDEVVEKPDNVTVLSQFLPFDCCDRRRPSGREAVLAVQYNVFDCGGVSIGVCLSHKIADGTSAFNFVNAWAARSRGENEAVEYPKFDATSYFPPRDSQGFMHNNGVIKKEKIVTRRFVFEKSAIAALREAASPAWDPTRVEAVSAFIWGRFLAICRSKSVSDKVFIGLHAVNLRERMVPPLPNHFFGNIYWIAMTSITAAEIECIGYSALANRLRNAISGVNSDYIKKLQNGSEPNLSFLAQVSKGETVIFNFTSWCRFPLYEADFGWGKPSWVCSPGLPFNNTVMLMSSRDGDGIEAWVNMLEEDMAIFQRQPELLSLVSSTVID